MPLSGWKTIEILQIVTYQSLNITSKPKEYLWEKLIILNRRKEESDKAEKRSKLFKLEKGKVC